MASPCVYYLRGACRFGDRCWNSHDYVRSDSPYLVESSEDERRENVSTHTASSASSARAPCPRPRQKRQASSDSAQKLQNSQTETQSDSKQPMWTLSNKNCGETREGTPDKILIDTVKKLNDAENEVNRLKQQLRSKSEEENFSWIEHQLEQTIDSDLQCNICYELFIKPTVLNCSHTFCHDCIESWTRRVNHCPTCRVYVRSKALCLTLDSFLDKIVEHLPAEVSSRRADLKIERNNNRENNRSRRNTNTNSRRRTPRGGGGRQMRPYLFGGLEWGDRDRDLPTDFNISLEEALFDPIRLGDVLGRNRSDRDEWDDNLSDSSIESSSEFYEYSICPYCDNMGHSAFNCPLAVLEENGFL